MTVRNFVLIPGAWHGAWCWHKLTPLLLQAGAKVIAPELSSGGSFEEWAQSVAGIVDREPGCVLVGHSRGGAVRIAWVDIPSW